MRFALLLFAAAALAFASDVTGTWHFQVETDAASGAPTMIFKQNGNTVTGHYNGQLREAPLKGTIDGNRIEFSFEISTGAASGAIRYQGTVEGDTMKGTVDLAGQAAGTFTGKKKQ